MRKFETFNVGDSLEAFIGLRPESSSLARKRFAKKAGGHLEYDYKGSRGLRMVGYGECECVSSIHLFIDSDDTVDICFMVTVDTPDGDECFDSSEALGYSEYIKAAAEAAERREAVKQIHYQNRRNESCEE